MRPIGMASSSTFIFCGSAMVEALIGVATVSNEAAVARAVAQRCEAFLAARPECDLLAARMRLFRPGEDFPPD